jgi:lipoyl(octanoyl) transferase
MVDFQSEFLGRIDFEKAFQKQEELWLKSKTKNLNFILGLEHPAVITLGRRAEHEEINPSNQIPIIKASRGGLATLHSEGQLVIYPIINIRKLNLGVSDYVDLLLRTTQKVFTDLGLETFIDDKNIGLYTKNGKIAFCGLQIKNGISLHGLSINISNDLNLFKNIRSCGYQDLALDSLSNYRSDVSISIFFNQWLIKFTTET